MTNPDGARCVAIGVAICRNGLARIFANTRSNGPCLAKSGAESPTAAMVFTRPPVPLSRALSRATRTASGSMSLASTFTRNAFAAAMASTPVTASHQHGIEQQQTAARGAMMAGAERQRGLDLDAELVGRHL